MSYLVLARKYRPKSFAALKGQEHVTQALASAIARNTIHHAFLFTGTRGVGKTTVARILAKCLNCEQGVQAIPCGQCKTCLEIDAGRLVDLIEVDGASRTRIEDTKELLENVQYAPTSARYKIYLIDEVHMLSTHSFNALLKTLEEPPPYVKFILATTSPERIPVTILSRCLRFTLRALTQEEIVVQLKEILTTEHITFEDRALHHIAKAGQGSMRDALSILEQAIAYSDNCLTCQSVEAMLSITYLSHLPALLTVLLNKDMRGCLDIVKAMDAQVVDYDKALKMIIAALHAYAISQVVPGANQDLLDFDLPSLPQTVAPEEIQLMYQIALMGHKELQLAPIARVGFEMTMLRMMMFRPSTTAETKAVAIPKAVVAPKAPQPKVPTANAPQAMKPVAQIAPPVPAPIVPPVKKENGQLNWSELVKQLPLAGLTRILVQNCVLTKWDGENMELTLDEMQKACLNAPRQAQIQDAIAQHLQAKVKLTILVGSVTATPVMEMAAQRQEKEQAVKASVQDDQMIQNMISTFGATVETVKVDEHD